MLVTTINFWTTASDSSYLASRLSLSGFYCSVLSLSPCEVIAYITTSRIYFGVSCYTSNFPPCGSSTWNSGYRQSGDISGDISGDSAVIPCGTMKRK